MNKKGQGALEYLLLIGGAVLVASIVIALITGIPTTTQNPEAATKCAMKATYASCSALSCNVASVGPPAVPVSPCVKTAAGLCYACQPLKADMTNATATTDFASCGLGNKKTCTTATP